MKKIICRILFDIFCLILMLVIIGTAVWGYTKLVSDYNEIILLVMTICILIVFLVIVIINRKYEFKEKELEFYKEQLEKINNNEVKIAFLEKII